MNDSSQKLTDQWGRQMDYLRIAVTDRCNLRCFYCMPEEGINFLPKKELLTYEELLRLSIIFCDLGVKKIRITGGEPFVRKDLITFLGDLKQTPGLEKLHLTTNGVLTSKYIAEMVNLGIDGINLSLDSLEPQNFFKITRRNEFTTVENCLRDLVGSSIPLKINVVVMRGLNDHEIIPMAKLAQHDNLHVRFIEEMPFNGSTESNQELVSHKEIRKVLESEFGELQQTSKTESSDPASLFQIKGFIGKIGIIPAYTRTFCGSCNRIRLTATGTIKNCLYVEGVFDLKGFLRSGVSDSEVKSALLKVADKKEKNGMLTESNRLKNKNIQESMSEIGG